MNEPTVFNNNELTLFENEEFGTIRVITIGDELWFVAVDVCNALELSNPTMAVSRLDEDERAKFNLGRQGDTTIVNEPGLYTLVLGSRKKEAKAFKHWITHEVIPSIRKHGTYMTPQTIDALLSDPDTIIKLATELKEERAKAEQLKAEKEYLEKENNYKEDVIVGLVEDIDLAEKRQRINQIVRHGVKNSKDIGVRWNLLYGEFEKKYHINLSARLERYRNDFKPKLKNQLDLIDRKMNMIPQLYEVCCKLFHSDVKELMKTWEDYL